MAGLLFATASPCAGIALRRLDNAQSSGNRGLAQGALGGVRRGAGQVSLRRSTCRAGQGQGADSLHSGEERVPGSRIGRARAGGSSAAPGGRNAQQEPAQADSSAGALTRRATLAGLAASPLLASQGRARAEGEEGGVTADVVPEAALEQEEVISEALFESDEAEERELFAAQEAEETEAQRAFAEGEPAPAPEPAAQPDAATPEPEAPAQAPAPEPAPTPAPAQPATSAPKLECFPSPDSIMRDAEGQPFRLQTDDLNACVYLYPDALPYASDAAKPQIPSAAVQTLKPAWVLTRPPERYSSAAPLSPDARLRIVSERLFVARSVTISVAISPPNDSFLELPPPLQPEPAPGATSTTPASAWTPLRVARSVLTDRTSPRMTTAQRLQETVVGDVSSADICGIRYFYCEYLQSRSPTTITGPTTSEVFRHSLAVTAEREGYLYTLTVSCLDPDWPVLEKSFRSVVGSFRLVPTTSTYVPPYKDPWRFW